MSPSAVDIAREAVSELCSYERRSTSEGERRAAHWLARRLRDLGFDPVVEEERAYGEFARSMATIATIGALSSVTALTGRARRIGAAAGLFAAVAIAEDAGNGPQLFRRLTSPMRTCWNVTAAVGEPSAPITVVVLAHHDAPATGVVFDQAPQYWLAGRFPDFIERTDKSMPLWWPVIGFPALGALFALTQRRRPAYVSLLGSTLAAASFADIHRSAMSPGANDNASGVAALLGLAAALAQRPVEGVRVVLASCGAEEVLQGGIRPWMRRHGPGLDPSTTYVLNFETVGSPRLVMVEGEGTVLMEEYAGSEFRDRVADVAAREGIALRRGLQASASTDSVHPSRAGMATATFCSVDAAKALSNYHRVTDTPENLCYETVGRAVDLAEAVIRDLAD